MTKTMPVLLALVCMSAFAKDKSEVTYVGMGRYTCSGNTAACAQIDANNRAQSDRDARQYQERQDHAQGVVDRERRRDEERRQNREPR